jgi:hypothetical protein
MNGLRGILAALSLGVAVEMATPAQGYGCPGLEAELPADAMVMGPAYWNGPRGYVGPHAGLQTEPQDAVLSSSAYTVFYGPDGAEVNISVTVEYSADDPAAFAAAMAVADAVRLHARVQSEERLFVMDPQGGGFIITSADIADTVVLYQWTELRVFRIGSHGPDAVNQAYRALRALERQVILAACTGADQ